MLPFPLKIGIHFAQNGHWKRENVKIHYREAHFAAPNLCFFASKTMVSLSKTYDFTLQNLCFRNPKPMFLSANIRFLRTRKTRLRCNLLLISRLQNVSQNSRISRPSSRLCPPSPPQEPSTRIFHDNFMRRKRSVCRFLHIRLAVKETVGESSSR